MSLAESHPDLAIGIIKECLKKASHLNGQVFGGYIRDVIVPRLEVPNCLVQFNDVDLWFDNQRDANLFLEAMGQLFVGPIRTQSPSLYPFTHQQYMFIKHNTWIVSVNVMVSNELPIDDFDFDVDRLTYYIDTKGNDKFKSFDPIKSVDDLKISIYRKTATMFRGCITDIPSQFSNSRTEIYLKHLKTRYLERGWTIKVTKSGKDIFIPTNIDANWIKCNLGVVAINADPVISTSTEEISTHKSKDKIKAEVLEEFNTGLESIRSAFVKLLDATL